MFDLTFREGKVREFALYGETTGETDEFGLPVRYNWAAEYRGNAIVVYGHTPVPEPEWLNKTINIDYRLCVWQCFNRIALPGAGVRLGQSKADVLRTSPTISRRRAKVAVAIDSART